MIQNNRICQKKDPYKYNHMLIYYYFLMYLLIHYKNNQCIPTALRLNYGVLKEQFFLFVKLLY